ncbi:Uncharacterized protein BM_BM10882 [Brugia malayi]|uniref:Uncharacterized protein n=1 Tax=Brugia malayi TaxID=6279 RepID=A0A4E9F3Z8_BRUMA|nr:Uncharacterized protein BM_BM10882 [Brugia malayi]VIO90968.1 Uncharacterized protein BM_BM10882 [Brugia malayi]
MKLLNDIYGRQWCNGQHGCLPSNRRGFDSPLTHLGAVFSLVHRHFTGCGHHSKYPTTQLQHTPYCSTLCWLMT